MVIRRGSIPLLGIMNIIAFDTGMSTGIALVSRHWMNYSNVFLKTVDELELSEFLSVLEMRSYNKRIDKVIIEKIPLSSQWILQRIYNRSHSVFNPSTICEIYPARWKPFAKAQNWTCSLAKTQHEEDAYNMLRYYIRTQLEKEL
jgi:hypothetical protein